MAFLLAPPIATATTPTPSPTASRTPSVASCPGDCNASASVVVGEVITCINIALGNSAAGNCLACDSNGDGRVTIAELLVVVRAALDGCGDRYEPDDTPALAKPIQCGASQRRQLEPAGDQDWMILSVGQHSSVTLSTFGSSGDPTMELFDASTGLSLEYSDDVLGAFPRISRSCGLNALPAGDYYIRMRGYSGSVVPDYTIEVSCVPCGIPNPTLTPTPGPDAFEPDDSPEQAAAIACGEVQSRTFSSYDDQDWVTLTPAERSTVHIIVSSAEYADPEIVLFDPDGPPGVVMEYGDSTLRRDCGSDALDARTYQARVKGYQYAHYDLLVLCEPCGVPNPAPTATPTATARPTLIPADAAEPDNTREEAVPIMCGQGAIRSLAPQGDTDWFVLDLPERTAVSLRIFGYGTELALQASSGIDIDYSYGYGYDYDINRTCGVNALEAGRYFVEVLSSSQYVATYDFVVVCRPCTAPNAPTFAPPTRTPTPQPLPLDRYEPNNSPEEATEIECGSLQSHTIHGPFDQDWVSFTVPQNTAVTLSTGGFLPLGLYDADLNYRSSGSGIIANTCRQPLPAGRYYASVDCFYCDPQNYNLSLTCGSCVGAGLQAVDPSPPPTPTPTPVK